jgi:hypothetical protein
LKENGKNNNILARKIPKIIKEIQKATPQPVNYAYQKGISYSQMSLFNSCPHRWKLQYKDRIKVFTSSIHTVFGTAIHETIQHYLNVMYSSSGAESDRLDLEEIFQEKFVGEYKVQYKSNNNQHFSSAEEMREFFEDGVDILNWLKKKRTRYFSRKGWYLVGCEVPIVTTPNKMYNNVLYNGFLDVILYHEPTNTFKIIDIKTSTRGWRDKEKKDENKQFQLILYKHFFSEQYNIPIDSISVEFFIVKRKVMDWDDEKILSPHQAYRVQNFTPASGKIKISRAKNVLNDFIKKCFTTSGEVREGDYPKMASKWNCSFCPFKEDKHNCGEGIVF